MRFGRLGQLKHGYNAMTTRESDMLMDIGYQEMDENEIVEFEDPLQETAFVITTGDVEICCNGKKELMHRESLLDENPYCLHVPHGVKVVVKALKKSELLIQKTLNDRDFEPVFYRPKDVQADVFGGGVWQGTAERTVRTIFDYDNAPYSNMVNGEVIMTPGCWTGWPSVFRQSLARISAFMPPATCPAPSARHAAPTSSTAKRSLQMVCTASG